MYIRNLKKAFSISLIALMFVFAAVAAANAENDRFRVKHGNYRTDQQGVNVLQQAVNEGYRQGFQVGQQDRSSRRKSNWKKNNIYRSGDMGYDRHVDRSQYQYYFQQGFQRGYDDGYNSRNRYGSNNSVLANILNLLLKPRRY